MIIEPEIVKAILVLATGAVASFITQQIKRLLKLANAGAVILTALVCAASTAIFFLVIQPPFEWSSFVVYSVVVFCEATGLYHFFGGPVIYK